MSEGDYSIGSDKLNGLSKVIEECGEVVQVAAKIIGNNGSYVYWDEPDLKKLLIEELGDVIATIDYFGVHNLTLEEREQIIERAEMKFARFQEWNARNRDPQ